MNNTDDNKNMIYFLIASMALLGVYQYFVLGPQQKKKELAARAVAAAASSSAAAAGIALNAAGVPIVTTLSRDQALALSPRVKIDTPSLKGSISLKGGLIDDLYLAKYHDTTDPKSPLVELLRPANTDRAYYIQSGYFAQNVAGIPDANTLWTLTSGSALSPGKPIVLSYVNPIGLTFTRTLSVDENYMITSDDAVSNNGAQSISIQPFSTVMRSGIPDEALKAGIVHEGILAAYSSKIENGRGSNYLSQSLKYKDMVKDPTKKAYDNVPSIGGWFGITDKYWMAAVIPNQSQAIQFTTKATTTGTTPIFRAGYADNYVTIPAGQTWKSQSHIFAGAKQTAQLEAYQNGLHIPRFGYATDWGNLQFITYPMYWLLDKLYGFIGNFGIAILALTVIVKLVFYPLAHNSYESMTKMRQVQDRLKPKLDAIKARYPDDAQKQQEATMALYQEEKVNPMAGLGGCLPMLLQLPVFWGLYKVLQLAIEMRHAPFFGWIKDLSAPDSTSIINLFGLLPFDPANVPLAGTVFAGPLHIGAVVILYGFTMWLSQQMTPMTGVDPMQKKMMSFMPLMLIFFMAHVAIGLIIYWIWSNILTILQQYTIMHRLKVSNPIDSFIAQVTTPKKTAA